MKSRIVLLGPPASGKGTQATLLAGRHGLPTVSTGAILRKAVRDKTPLGLEVEHLSDDGGFAPDELVLRVVEHWLNSHSDTFVFDGFPRTLGQAKAFDQLLFDRGTRLEAAVLIHLSEDIIRDRVLNRLICMDCGAVFNRLRDGLERDEPCPACSGTVERRDDDTEAVLAKRLEWYERETLPVAEYYRQTGRLFEVRGGDDPEEVFTSMEAALTGKPETSAS